MTDIQKLQEERAGLVHRMREIYDAADAEGRKLTSEERAEYDGIEADVDVKGQRIADELKLAKRETELEELEGLNPRQLRGRGDDLDTVEDLTKAYNDAFETYVRH